MVILNNSHIREPVSHEDIDASSPFVPFDCSLLEKVNKKYGANGSSRVHLMSFGADRFRFAMSHQCQPHRSSQGNLVLEEALCGEVHFTTCSCEGTPAAKKQLETILNQAADRPHGIIVGNQNVDWAIESCNAWGVPVYKLDGQPIRLAAQITAEIKAQLVEERMMGNQQQFAEAHRRGFGAGRREAEAGHAPQVAQARASGEAKGQADVRFLRQLNLLETTFPLSLCDTYTRKPMQDPVVTKTGKTYERASIMPFLLDTGKEPGTVLPLKPEELIPNRLYKDLLRCVGLTKWSA
eukprot:EG_transcript_20175